MVSNMNFRVTSKAHFGSTQVAQLVHSLLDSTKYCASLWRVAFADPGAYAGAWYRKWGGRGGKVRNHNSTIASVLVLWFVKYKK